MFIMLHYDLAMFKKTPEMLPALRWILSLWAVNLVIEIYEIMYYKYMV